MTTLHLETNLSQDVRVRTQVIVSVAVVINERGELLLTHRHEPELPDAHDHWELPGGRVEHGEAPHAAAVREVAEETGYVITVDEAHPFVATRVWRYPDRLAHTVVIGYRAKLVGGQRKILGGKVRDVRWWPIDQLPVDRLLGESQTFIQAFWEESRHGPQ